MKKKKIGKIFLTTFLIILGIAIIIMAIIAGYIYSKISKVNTIKLENIEINQGVEEQLEGYRNIAIFGVDARADTYNNTRSDCIIIVSINEKTNEAKLTSVYRDTYVYIEGYGYDKITHAYAYGGPQLAINTLNKNLDLDIKEFVAVNFDAVVEIIDEIKGININIEQDELKYINSYINNIDKQMGRKTEKITTPGNHTLSGVQALAYSRIRYTAGGDYKRTERMRHVIEVAFQNVKSKSVIELDKLSNLLLPKVYTNITEKEILAAIPKVSKYNIKQSQGWPYDIREYYPGSVWYGAPVTLETNVKKLHEVLFEDEEYEVSETVKRYSDEICRKTGYK